MCVSLYVVGWSRPRCYGWFLFIIPVFRSHWHLLTVSDYEVILWSGHGTWCRWDQQVCLKLFYSHMKNEKLCSLKVRRIDTSESSAAFLCFSEIRSCHYVSMWNSYLHQFLGAGLHKPRDLLQPEKRSMLTFISEQQLPKYPNNLELQP